MKTNKHFKPILWTLVGALSSLFIICPLIISLLQYDWFNHRKPLTEVIIYTYKYFLWEIDFDRSLSDLIFLTVGGVFGNLFYLLKKSRNSKDKNVTIEELLKKGESELVEFKSSLRWDFKLDKINKDLELAVLKTIAAFLNTRRGTLLIGIADDASIIGLEKDFQSLKKKDRDGFEQYIMHLVSLNIGANYCQSIHVYFIELQGKDICIIEVNQIHIPVFLKFHGNTLFYVRTGNHTRELDIQEALKYIRTHKS